MILRDFRVHLSYPTSNVTDERIVTLKIIDEASSMIVFDADFTSKQWVEVQSTLNVTVAAQTSDHPERLGKTMECKTAHFPPGTPDDELETFKEDALWCHGWETATIRNQNNGRSVVLRRWVDGDANA